MIKEILRITENAFLISSSITFNAFKEMNKGVNAMMLKYDSDNSFLCPLIMEIINSGIKNKISPTIRNAIVKSIFSFVLF